MKINREPWSAQEDEVLRQDALAGRSVSEIAREVRRTESAVQARAYILRVKFKGKQGLKAKAK